jgi:hypothetical protein
MTDANPPQERDTKTDDRYSFENWPLEWRLVFAAEKMLASKGPWFLLRPKTEVDGAIEDLLHRYMKPLSPMPPGETIGEGVRRIGYYRFGRDILRAAIHDALDY